MSRKQRRVVRLTTEQLDRQILLVGKMLQLKRQKLRQAGVSDTELAAAERRAADKHTRMVDGGSIDLHGTQYGLVSTDETSVTLQELDTPHNDNT